MNRQEIFDKAVEHMATQGEQSASVIGDCKYRQEKNGRTLKCVAGAFIPDDAYVPDMDSVTEDTTVRAIVRRHSDKLPAFFVAEQDLLRSLQSVHDRTINWMKVRKMRDHLREVAKEYELSPAAVDKFYPEVAQAA